MMRIAWGKGVTIAMKRHIRVYPVIIFVILGFCILFNIAAWRSTAFSDFYTDNIFPVLTSAYGRLTSLLPFSIGEKMLVFIVLYVAFTVVFIVVHTAFMVYSRMKGKKKENSSGEVHSRMEKVFGKISDFLYKVTPGILAVTCLVMSLNCFVLYHCTKLQVVGGAGNTEYNLQQLTELRDYVVKKCNKMATLVPHDADGNVLFTGDMQKTAMEAMAALSKDYPRLDGYYVTPKALYFSDFMCQQYMQGYYFPFSMEANYNDTMNMLNKPFTMCHELAHTHGYIYEDEANFFGFLACISSDDIVFQYSGWLGVLNYINNDFYRAVDRSVYDSHIKISDRVKYDNQFLSPEGWVEVEKKAIIKTETVKKAADVFIDTNLKVNGVDAGKVSYGHVVGLIMDWYYGDGNIIS